MKEEKKKNKFTLSIKKIKTSKRMIETKHESWIYGVNRSFSQNKVITVYSLKLATKHLTPHFHCCPISGKNWFSTLSPRITGLMAVIGGDIYLSSIHAPWFEWRQEPCEGLKHHIWFQFGRLSHTRAHTKTHTHTHRAEWLTTSGAKKSSLSK